MEKEIATHSSIPAWEIPWTDKPSRLVNRVAKELGRSESLNNNRAEESFHTHVL